MGFERAAAAAVIFVSALAVACGRSYLDEPGADPLTGFGGVLDPSAGDDSTATGEAGSRGNDDASPLVREDASDTQLASKDASGSSSGSGGSSGGTSSSSGSGGGSTADAGGGGHGMIWCDQASCPTGCCYGNVCALGTQDIACGIGGGACNDCTVRGGVCTSDNVCSN